MKLYSRPIRIAWSAILCTFILISFNNGCKKIDRFSNEFSKAEIESEFFAAKPGVPLPVLKVIDALKKQNDIGGFIPFFARQTGYAMWEKSQVKLNKVPAFNRGGENDEAVEVFTPIVQHDSNFVNGFFFSKIVGDSVELHLYRANDYDLYPNGKMDSSITTAERVAFKLVELNEEVFGHTKFRVMDSSLFRKFYPEHHDGCVRKIELKSSDTASNNFAYHHTAVFCQEDQCLEKNSTGSNVSSSMIPGTCIYC